MIATDFSSGSIIGSEKTILRCIVRSSCGPLAAEERLRQENYRKWLKNKSCELLARKKSEKKAEELAKREEKRLLEEQKTLELERNVCIEKWLQQKKLQGAGGSKHSNEKRSSVNNKAEKIGVPDKTSEAFLQWLMVKDEEIREKKLLLEREAEIEAMKNQKMLARKVLAEESYEKWKQDTRQRNIQIPKNGFQIFGPNPKCVVQQEWVNFEPSNEPKRTRSLLVLTSPSSHSVDSFRSEARLDVPRLQLDNMNLVPWCRRRFLRNNISSGSACSTPASSNRTFVKQPPAVRRREPKKKPPFR